VKCGTLSSAEFFDPTRSDIQEINTLRQSTMPDGLEKRLTDREFLDLLAFLQSLKKRAK
jgi:hypothetical protein